MRTSKSSHWRARSISAACPSEGFDPKLVTYDVVALPYRRGASVFDDLDAVNSVIGQVWRGMPKVHGQVKQPTRAANCLGACVPRHDLPSTTNHQRRSVFKTVGVSSMFSVG